ncbi:hypothetical protein Asal01_01720 [Fodinibius salicampi]
MQSTATRNDQSKLKSKAPADGSRRYDKGTFPAYDTEYQRLEKRSDILKGSIKNLKPNLIQLEGNDDGRYKQGGSWKTALIPLAKENLKEVYRDFKIWQKQQVRSGEALKPPKEWPDELLKERLKVEARLDVRRAEKFTVEKAIEQNKREEKRKRGQLKKQRLLPHGPLGKGVNPKKGFKEGTEVDGQVVKYSKSDVPYIDEPDSPYHQMPIFHYKKMVIQWRKEVGIDKQPFDLNGLREKRDEIHRKRCKEATAQGKEPPTKKLIVTPGKIAKWIDRLEITKADWPEWPEGAKSITELEQNESS